MTRRRSTRRARSVTGVVVALATAAALAACGTGANTPTAGRAAGVPGSASSVLTGKINVFAAASLMETFTTLTTQFEEAHPGVKITLNFGASSALANGITQGQPADVFASASPTNMDAVINAGDASSSTAFAKNVMEIAVPPANPGDVKVLADLAKPGLKVALCQPQVPCGRVAAKVFSNAKLTLTPVSQEADVKSVLTKVQLGEVDAGVVYVTDVKAAGTKVKGIEIPSGVNASTSYPIATLTSSANPKLADAFVAYVLSSKGTDVLKAAGFGAP